MKTTATMSTNGRVTIPSKLRKKYGIKVGDRLEFKLVKGAVQVKPAK